MFKNKIIRLTCPFRIFFLHFPPESTTLKRSIFFKNRTKKIYIIYYIKNMSKNKIKNHNKLILLIFITFLLIMISIYQYQEINSKKNKEIQYMKSQIEYLIKKN